MRRSVSWFMTGLLVFGAAATDTASAASDDIHWLLGIGPTIRPDYEGSEDYEPYFGGTAKLWWNDGRYVHLRGVEGSAGAARMEANLVPDSMFVFGPVAQYRLKRGDVDNDAVSDLKTVDAAFELGGFIGLREGDWTLRSTFSTDVSGEHDGSLIELALAYMHEVNETFQMGAGVASTWASNGYMGQYFSIGTQNSARSGLATYDADAGFKDVGGNVSFMWGMPGWRHVRVAGKFAYYRMIGDAEDSPVVDDVGSKNQLFGGLMLVWVQ